MAKITIEFDGFDEMIERFDELGKDIKPAIEKSLKKTHEVITPGVKSAIAPHHLSGDTEGSLRMDSAVKWTGNVAEVKVGFNIAEGGLPSVFLMYGTPAMRPDMKLWSAFFGTSVKSRVEEIQTRIVMEELSL